MQVCMKYYGTEILENVNLVIQFNGIAKEPAVLSFNYIHSNFFLSILILTAVSKSINQYVNIFKLF